MTTEEEAHAPVDEMRELEGILRATDDDTELGELAVALTRVSDIVSAGEKIKKGLKAQIISKLDSAGLDGAIAGGRRLGFSQRTYYGVAQGGSPRQYAENLRQMKEFLERVAPEKNLPTSANMGKALNAYLDSNPEAEVPEFVAVTTQRTLTNGKHQRN